MQLESIYSRSLNKKLKITFIDTINWDYNPETPYKRALGGTQSALCYLSAALAKAGHEIHIINNTKNNCYKLGVNCIKLKNDYIYTKNILDIINTDIIIVLSLPTLAKQLRGIVKDKVKLYLWTQHSFDQNCCKSLEKIDIQNSWDGFIFVSSWQRESICRHYGIGLDKTYIIKNAISPPFENLFKKSDTIHKTKDKLPTLVYNSTPFRGLEILLKIYPRIKEIIPEIKLKVISSMKTYQIKEEDDQYKKLYEQCQKTQGIEYIGSVSQPELSKILKSSHILSYPNTFAETSCISVMEAMASGCTVITSDLGALKETTAGFAKLIQEEPGSENYIDLFTVEIISLLNKYKIQTDIVELSLKEQVAYTNKYYNWSNRAIELIKILETN